MIIYKNQIFGNNACTCLHKKISKTYTVNIDKGIPILPITFDQLTLVTLLLFIRHNN